MGALVRFSCDQCDAMTQAKIPRRVSVPLMRVQSRCIAMAVKLLRSREEEVHVMAGEASNVQHI